MTIIACQVKFIVSLQANDCNVEIMCDGCGEAAVDSMALSLLNPHLPHTSITGYKAPSLHTQTLSWPLHPQTLSYLSNI